MEMQINSCPCCGGTILRHVRQGGVYWFCTSCCQEVPLLTVSKISQPQITINKPPASAKPSRSIQTVN